MSPTPLPVALTVAGSDSGGGAGIQADLKTFQRFGVFGTSVVTAVTAQNTVGVSAVHEVPVDVVTAQIGAVATDLEPSAVKSGMLASAPLVEAVADGIGRHELGPYVLDPVMVATSGDRLLEPSAVEAVIDRLLPLADVVTPNLPEAAILTGAPVEDAEGMRQAAEALVARGAGAALVKGGHLDGEVLDLFWDGTTERIWRAARIDTRHTHGTGCTLSAAIAAQLANGLDRVEAIDSALRFVRRAIESAPGLGAGHGPLNHFAPTD